MVKKIFQINSVLNIGSTGRITEEIGSIAIDSGWESHIAAGRISGESRSNVIRIGKDLDFYAHVLKTRLFDLHGFGSEAATRKLVNDIGKIDPDVIVLHNLHGYYVNIELLFSFLKECNKPIFWTLYDCWSFTGHCAYFDMVGCEKWKSGCFECPSSRSYPSSLLKDNSQLNYLSKREIFNGVKNLNMIVHSNWLAKQINNSFLKEYPVKIIRNGVNLSLFKPSPESKLKEQLNISDKFVILGVANIWSTRKGMRDFIELSDHLSDDEVIILDGAGKKLKNCPNSNIIPLDKAKTVGALSELYSIADVFINPTWEDNFPTTNLEALACGTPVITYDTGGSPEAIDESTGFVVSRGDIKEIIESIKTIRSRGVDFYRLNCVERAKKFFDYRERYGEYVEFFDEVLSL